MHITIYADVLFLTNFLANLFLLRLTEKITKITAPPMRKLAAAFLGGIYACAAFFPQLSLLQSFIFRVLTAGVMLHIAFHFRSYKHFLRCNLIFLTASLLSGGICYALFFMTQLGIKTGTVFKSGIFYWHIPATVVLLAFFAASGILYAFETLANFYVSRKENLYTICVDTDGGRIALPALLDTGNALYDPPSRLPVLIAEADCFPKLATPCSIPYRTLAGETHFLPSFRPKSVEINGCPAADCMLALTQTRLSCDGSYRALIHPALIQGGLYDHNAKVTSDK